MRLFSSIALASLLTIACSDRQSSVSAEPASATPASSPSMTLGSASTLKPASGIAPALPGRTGELINPNNDTIVFLYYELAGIRPPLDQWVEQDTRVSFAPPLDKASLRSSVRAELESAAAAVRGVGFIRLSMDAGLSDYDPAYGEFYVRALSPSSTLDFSALGQKVSLRFGNGRLAQVWSVPPAEAQVIKDKIGRYGRVSLDALLRIASVQPGAAGGTITTEVVEYEMREAQRGLTIGRVQVAQR